MGSLARLADQVLDQILGLISLDIATLWVSGDLLLQQKVTRCCRSVVTTDLGDAKLRKWPFMLSSLRSLETLVLDVKSFDDDLEVLRSKLQVLSSSIKRLELRFIRSSLIVLEDFMFDRRPRQTDKFRLPGYTREDFSVNNTCWNIKHNFPSLEKVVLGEKEGILLWSFSLASLDSFPPTLTDLEWDVLIMSETACTSIFPALTSLRFVRRNFYHTVPLAKLLPNLTHLDGLLLPDVENILRLPKTLKTGNCIEPQEALTPLYMASMPPLLENLGSVSFTAKIAENEFDGVPWTSTLPRSLTEISIDCLPLTSRLISLLPITLTSILHLKLDFNELVNLARNEGVLAARKIWPPNLTFLSLPEAPPRNLYILPPSLKSLKLHVFKFQEFVDCANTVLPPHLTRLHCTSLRTEAKLMVPLPSQLKAITFVSTDFDDLSRFPRDLEELHLPEMKVNADRHKRFIQTMPPRLKVLSLLSLDNSAIPLLPVNLKEVYIRGKKGLVRLKMGAIASSEQEEEEEEETEW